MNGKQVEELQKLVMETRRELGDWNRDGTDRPDFTYPGDLNAGPKQKVGKRSRAKKMRK